MRQIQFERTTKETQIQGELTLEGTGEVAIRTGIGFLDHMLTAMSFYAGFNLTLTCQGDLGVDSHHTVEDIGLALGAALKEALGDRRGITRFAASHTPMDESLVLVAIDLSNRPFLAENLTFSGEYLGTMHTQDFQEFFRAFAYQGGMTLHIDLIRGGNDHHQIEAIFKGLGRSLKEAVSITGEKINSTKGVI